MVRSRANQTITRYDFFSFFWRRRVEFHISFQLLMELRLRPLLGGDGITHRIVVLNDTGSSTLTICYTDLAQLGNHQMYYGWSPDTHVVTANGATDRLHSLWVEIRVVFGALGTMDC